MILVGSGIGTVLLLTGFGTTAIPTLTFASLTAGVLLTGMN
ncbi:hypothetical protein AB3Y40_05405 [Yoonia sp. R2331]